MSIQAAAAMAAAPTTLAEIEVAPEVGLGAAEPEAAGATLELEAAPEEVAFEAVALAEVTPSL